MGATGIEWTKGPNGEPGFTFNPWIGCTRISPACGDDTGGGCYAEKAAVKMKVEWGPKATRRGVSDATWRAPLTWDRKAQSEGRRYRVFVASMADILDNHRTIDPDWRERLYSLIAMTPNLDWLMLTKRPELARRFLPPAWFAGLWPENVWFGFTAENQVRFDHCTRFAQTMPAPIIFMSGEPLLGRIDLPAGVGRWLRWIIAGGESGPHARNSHPIWFYQLRDQCAENGVPFHFKQWGEWWPSPNIYSIAGDPKDTHRRVVSVKIDDKTYSGAKVYQFPDGVTMVRIGTQKAGHLLAGAEHYEFPEDERLAA